MRNADTVLDIIQRVRSYWRADNGESVRHGTHGENCPRRGPEFKVTDSEATALPRPERAREQEHGWKAGDVGRRVWHGPATPARYGESRIARIPMTSGGTAHSSVARLYSDAIGMHGIAFLPCHALADGRCAVSALKDMNGAPTLRSIRSSGAEHGRAYNTRVSRSRSSRSTQLGLL